MAIIQDGSGNAELTGKDLEEYLKKRFPKHDIGKKKPLMTVGCEEIVTSREQELEMRIEWLEKRLYGEVPNWDLYDEVPKITGDRDTDALLEDERINQENES
jgi:hypothetical protein